MTKLKLHTPDLTAANVERIAALFPNCVTEATDETGKLKRAIDFDLLKQELSADLVEGPQERYRLDWPGKREALALANTPVSLTLRPCREESVDFEITKNLYIEGDNLDALKLLQETYLGKVKMIYIDPPNNTGNDFIYDDNFSMARGDYEELSGDRDEQGNAMFDTEKWKQNSANNGRYHSEWLSMMYSRLKLARNLLSDDGAAFISIDDNEANNLSKILDEVFGASNFCGRLAVVNNLKGRNDKKNVATCHEHLLIYGKSNQTLLHGLPLSDEQKAEYKHTDSQGRKYALRDLRKRGRPDRREDRPNMWFPIFFNLKNKTCSFVQQTDSDVCITPKRGDGSDGRWRWGKQRVADNLSILEPRFSKKNNRWDIDHRVYLSEASGDSIEGDDDLDEQESLSTIRSSKTKSFWLGGEISTDVGRRTFKSLFSDVEYDYPKPIALIERCFHLGNTTDSIILDFFSGSATTAHAVMQLNAQDGGKRRHIMVQLPEPCDEKSEAFKAGYKTIAEIGKERIRRAGEKILAEWQAKQAKEKPAQGDLLHPSSPISDPPSPPDIGFRVLKIDASNMKDVYYAPDEVKQDQLELHTDNIKDDRTPEDLLFQVLVDWGVDLTLPIANETIANKKVFFVDGDALAACFDPQISEELVKELARRKPLRAVFRDSGFGDDSMKINIEQIFKLLSPGTELKSL